MACEHQVVLTTHCNQYRYKCTRIDGDNSKSTAVFQDRRGSLQSPSPAMCFCWMESSSYSGLKAVIRAPSHPPCTGTGVVWEWARHSWRDRRPDTQQQVSNKFQNSSAAAKNSHLDKERDGGSPLDGGWMIEEWKLSRKGGSFIPFHIQSQCYHSGAEEKESCRVASSGTRASAFWESEDEWKKL